MNSLAAIDSPTNNNVNLELLQSRLVEFMEHHDGHPWVPIFGSSPDNQEFLFKQEM